MTRSRVPPVTRQYGVNRRAKILIAWLTWALSVLKLKLSGATTRLAYAYVNKVMFLLDVAHPKQNVTFRSRVSILSSCAVLNLLGLISTMQLRNGFYYTIQNYFDWHLYAYILWSFFHSIWKLKN